MPLLGRVRGGGVDHHRNLSLHMSRLSKARVPLLKAMGGERPLAWATGDWAPLVEATGDWETLGGLRAEVGR